MEWIESPESSNIARFAYDASNQFLTVQFKNGGTYNYFDIPPRSVRATPGCSVAGWFSRKSHKGLVSICACIVPANRS